MSLSSHNEQYDLIARMRLENEAETERQIRSIATDYLSRRVDPAASYQLGPQRFHITPHGMSAGYRAPTAAYPSVPVIELVLDVAPGIQGFEAQIIAEEQLRDQISQLDTT